MATDETETQLAVDESQTRAIRLQQIRRRHTPVQRLSPNGDTLLTVCPTCNTEHCDADIVSQVLSERTEALDAWIRAYANIEPLASPKYEVNLFRVWLQAVAVMGYKATGVPELVREIKGGVDRTS